MWTSWQTVEELVQASLEQYQIEGLLTWQRNYPEIIVKKYPQAIIVGKAVADFTVSLRGGQVIHLEVKSWRRKDTTSYDINPARKRQRRAYVQYQWMRQAAELDIHCYYLTYWQWDQGNEHAWRLFPILSLPFSGESLLFERRAGMVVRDDYQDLPHWLGPVGSPEFEGGDWIHA